MAEDIGVREPNGYHHNRLRIIRVEHDYHPRNIKKVESVYSISSFSVLASAITRARDQKAFQERRKVRHIVKPSFQIFPFQVEKQSLSQTLCIFNNNTS